MKFFFLSSLSIKIIELLFCSSSFVNCLIQFCVCFFFLHQMRKKEHSHMRWSVPNRAISNWKENDNNQNNKTTINQARSCAACVRLRISIYSFAKLIKVMLKIHLITIENAMRRHTMKYWVWSSKLDLFMVLWNWNWNWHTRLQWYIRACCINIASWLSPFVFHSSNETCTKRKKNCHLFDLKRQNSFEYVAHIFCIFSTRTTKKHSACFHHEPTLFFLKPFACQRYQCDCHFH